jgi:hypothetical protein
LGLLRPSAVQKAGRIEKMSKLPLVGEPAGNVYPTDSD